MKLSTKELEIPKSKSELQDVLNHVEDFKNLIPSQVDNLEVDGNIIRFQILGGTTIELEKQPPMDDKIHFISKGKVSFDLFVHLKEISSDSTEVYLEFEGNLNPMVAMMAKKPLQNFIDTIQNNIAQLT
jgi:carbon monoxide dehydrogenase subunit G